MNITHSLIRIVSFFSKELREVARRPGVLLSVVIGPFLILLLFGMGTTGFRSPFATEIVIPPDSGLPRDARYYADLVQGRIDVVRISEEAEAGEQRLRSGEIGLLIVAPPNAESELREGRQVPMRVAWNEVDPIADGFAQAVTPIIEGAINAEIIETVAAEGFSVAGAETGVTTTIAPEVIARPVVAEIENVAPTGPTVLNFYGPAVLALIIQHLGISLTSLALVRERLGGQIDRYRVAPVSATEVLLGKGMAYGVVTGLVAAGVGAVLVLSLGVPAIGGFTEPIIVGALLALASLGLGLVISLLADSEQQAVQMSMLLLLASVFLSGLVLPVSNFAPWMEPIAYSLPVTHGIAALQDTMLRGELLQPWMVLVLGVMTALLFLVAVLLLRRAMRSAG